MSKGLLFALLCCLSAALFVAACGEDGDSEGEGTHTVEPGRVVYGSSFVSPLVAIFGEVRIGERSFVAPEALFRADPGHVITVGNETNVQDNVTVNAIGHDSDVHDRTSVAHHAEVEDSRVGDFVFLGFRAQVTRAHVGDGAVVLHGATVEGVRLPPNSVVPPGATVTSQGVANRLPRISPADEEFKREVLDVNREFASSYVDLYEREGFRGTAGIGPNPVTSWNRVSRAPRLGRGAELDDFVRIIGDVRVGPGARIGQRSAIRADEGTPIEIGARADIGSHVTFHALEGTVLRIGRNVRVGDDSVIHGPLEVGDDVTIGDETVVFRAVVEDGVEIGPGAIVAGAREGEELTVPAGTKVPAGAVVLTAADLDRSRD